MLKFDYLGVDFYQTKCHMYIYEILKLFGSQGQRSRPLYGPDMVEKKHQMWNLTDSHQTKTVIIQPF